MLRILKTIRNLLLVLIAALVVSWVIYAPDSARRGQWKTDGYGIIFDVGFLWIDAYKITESSCQNYMVIPSHLGIVNFLEGIQFTNENNKLRLDVQATVNPIYADRIDGLPALCDPLTPGENAPADVVFDVFWEIMNEHYAFFDLHGVDWKAQQSLRPGTDTDNAALWEAMKTAISDLDDGHLYIAHSEDDYSPAIAPDWIQDGPVVRDATLSAIPNGLTHVAGSGLHYGFAAPDVGYVYFEHMDVEAGIGQRGAVKATAAFNEVAQALRDAKGIILDVRYNPGGSDDISLAYASFFPTEPTLGFSKTTRTETGYTEPTHAMTPVGPTTLTQPAVLLTTRFTASAAEIFTFAMRALPQVTTLGTNTSGGLSDILDYPLPNGWEIGLSHQIYLAPDGASYEAVGIPPDVVMEVDVEAHRNGRDPQLEAAIALINAGE